MKNILVFLLIPLFIGMACNIPVTTNITPTVSGPDYNATLLSLSIQITQTALAEQLRPTMTATPSIQPTGTNQPTATFQPTNTTMPSSTSIPTPCNLAGNVIDVTYVDDTKVNADTSFVKTWRIANIGSCTWTSGYSLIFDNGDQMGSPASVQLTLGTVPPGNSVEVSVQLIAPHTKGTYQGNYRLKAPDGTIFGIGDGGQGAFWVRIEVPGLIIAIIPPHIIVPIVPALPDIMIYSSWHCLDVKVGVPCKMEYGIRNQSDINVYQPFDLRLYIGTDPVPKCSWGISQINSKQKLYYSCDYTFPSLNGGSSISERLVVDEDNKIKESNESNNEGVWSINVTP
jgi:hypothetical protein